MAKQFTGGKFGYDSISVKPDGTVSEILGYHLWLLEKNVNSTNSIIRAVLYGWPNTLQETEAGSHLLNLLTKARGLEKEMQAVLQASFDPNNEVAFLEKSQHEVQSLRDDLLGKMGYSEEKDGGEEVA